MNTNPNNPTTSTPNFILPGIISNGIQTQMFTALRTPYITQYVVGRPAGLVIDGYFLINTQITNALNYSYFQSGGITKAALLTAAGTLYKDLDSLNVYAKVGTAAERRIDRRKLTTATGAAVTLNVDEPLPSGSAGQTVTFRFEATVRAPARRTSATAATGVAVVAPTSFSSAVRTGALTYAGNTGGDLAAYDLTTFAPVAAAGSLMAK